ncbi:hypothetical protein [Kutzneria sp. NPDC051319]|uniref:hypothetical protein n=1 Tax=Kutzneria sp. NPDC051319 TaxID=3155047 RepID=UPI0034479C60
MSKPEATFAEGVLGEDERDQVRWALGRIEADGEGAWPHVVRHVKVLKAFTDGRSGGMVLRVELAFEGQALTRVLKVDRVDVMAREWLGYQKIRRRGNSVFARVLAASRDVVAREQRSRVHDWGAIVYDDASEFAGDASSPAWTLLEVAADPQRQDETVTAIERLFQAARSTFYDVRGVNPDVSSLITQNRRLGVSLEIRSDDGPPAPALVHRILRRTTTGGPDDYAPGDRVAFEADAADPVVIHVDGAEASAGSGVVVSSRGSARRELLPTPAIPCADPFAALLDVLTTGLPGRVTSAAHGDLNCTNVMVVDGRPYLIDYAEFADGAPQQFDFSWLEVSLLRDVYASRDPAELIRLQRALALGSRLLHLDVGAEEVLRICRRFTHADNHDALRVLLTIRVQAHRLYPAQARPEWWRDHLAQLLLSAHRTLKWPAKMQSVAKLHAVTAVAAVATEWLTDVDPFEHWDAQLDQAKAELARHLRRVLRDASPQLAADLRVEHYLELAANDSPSVQKLLAEHDHVVLSGERGSGKTTVLREFGHRLVADDTKPVPLFVHARDFRPPMIDPEHGRLGVVHLILDDASPEVVNELHSLYPAMPILAAGEAVDGFEQVELRNLDERAIEIYLWRRVPEVAVEKLLDALLNDRGWQRLNIGRPRDLSLLVDYVAANGVPDSAVDLHRALLLAKVHGDEQVLRAGELLAMNLLDRNESRPVDARLIRSGIAVMDHGRIRFADNADRDHLAASGLRRGPSAPNIVEWRHTAQQWQDALTVYVARPDVSADDVSAVVERASSPKRKAELLASAYNQPATTMQEFSRQLERQLLHPDGTWARHASSVLLELGMPEPLSRVITSSEASDLARSGALTALHDLRRRARPGPHHRSASVALVAAAQAVLTEETSHELRQHACSVVAAASLSELGLLVAAQISPDNPWPLNHQAKTALDKLGVKSTPALDRAYSTAGCLQLARLAERLRGVTTIGQAFAIRLEQASITEHLTAQDRQTWFPRLRFGFLMSTGLLGEPPSVAGSVEQWLHDVESGPAEQAATAAHRLLAKAPDLAAEIVARLGRAPSADRLLIAAATMGADDLDWAEELVLRMLPTIDPADLEGPAALLVAVFKHHRMRGIRLALRAAEAVRRRDLPERRFGPWTVALGICHGEPGEHEALINEGDVALAIDALSSYGFLPAGEPGPDHVFGDDARARLLAAVTAENLVDWAHAAATARLVEAAPIIQRHIADGRPEPILQKAYDHLMAVDQAERQQMP